MANDISVSECVGSQSAGLFLCFLATVLPFRERNDFFGLYLQISKTQIIFLSKYKPPVYCRNILKISGSILL